MGGGWGGRVGGEEVVEVEVGRGTLAFGDVVLRFAKFGGWRDGVGSVGEVAVA